ncbi:MAG: TRAP transporter small permease [Deltaproteobacteria bacterium]|nr:TRAP transporter small permease [Deltaproteobacteria bacterium]
MKIIISLSRLLGYIATGVLGLMMLLTVADVFSRYFFNTPITGTTEVTELMMVIVVFLSLAWCAVRRRHVKVDILVGTFSPRAQAIIDSITLLAGLGIFSIITWQSFLESMDVRAKTSILQVPEAPFHWIMTLGFAMLSVVIVTLVIENLAGALKKERT